MAYTRKTVDEWEIQQNYGQGWECANTETTYKDAKRSIKEYRENMGQYPTRMIKKRVPKQEV
jgi:hypothetical protein